MISGSFNFEQIKPVNPLFALFPVGAYGIEHAYRVFKIVDRISDLEKIRDKLRQVLRFCALFHNIGQDENQLGANNGFTACEKLIEQKFPAKDRFDNELCRFLIQSQSLNLKEIQNHIDNYQLENREEALYLFRILKDALALDAFRFGNFCAADLELSNSRKLVLFASQFHRQELNQDLILKEIEDWLKHIQ